MSGLRVDRGSVATTPARNRRRLRTLSFTDRVLLGVLIGIPTLILMVFIWGPAIASIALSFTSWNGVGGLGEAKAAGLANYDFAIKTDPQFWPAIWHNFFWLIFFMVIATPLGMLFAVIIDRNIWGGRIYQSILFLPVMLSLALIGIIWQMIYSPNYGLLNSILGHTRDDNLISWLGNKNLNIWAILIEATWRQSGYVMVLYLAGLRAVDPTLREAAQIDGASQWQSFWHVIFPALRPVNVIIIVITVIESLRAYDLVYITSGGATVLPGLELLSMLITQNIFGQSSRIGYGSALASILLVISLVPISIFLTASMRARRR